MIETKEEALVLDEEIQNKIFLFRGQKVMLDSDLAELYGVETKRLKEQVKRNPERFPERYMFELTNEENHVLRSQNATLKRGEFSKYLPYVFTEHGILMLANVLKSDRAVKMSIRIIDIFVKLRETLLDNTDLWLQIERIKSKQGSQDKNIEIVFRYLEELMTKQSDATPRKRIGYMSDDL